MSDLKSRLFSYKNWPILMVNSKLLAEWGFYYTGVLDIVTCFSCNGSLGHWETNDDPFIEHEKFFPHCDYMNFIKMKSKNKVESLENKVLREACKIFSTLKVQKVAVENLRNTGQHFKSFNDVCEAVLKYENKASPPVTKSEKGNMDTVICKICMDTEIDVVFQPCSHLISCHICEAKIFDCPLCRNPVTHKIKVFRG
ncbi:hypothetical protein TNIN_323341 [Trichonephila inaurata madagascariensis]|uniref:RING-type domain-containing protein n=1 Tax=Trichonephila inaurata madagascariensis TaxID=2747483 RepID=A0A8X7BNU7_9ARAC|nr:hypothetical protein TNIN_323341 [Trichonephila inaurata madagascariensis]